MNQQIKIESITVTPFMQNCSLIVCLKTNEAALIDPGGDKEKIIQAVNDANVTIKKILLTHGHVDHVAMAGTLSTLWDVPIIGPHKGDDYWLADLDKQARLIGESHLDHVKPHQWLNDGDVIRLGQLHLEVIHCPGHTPGHVVFFERGQNIAWVGDVLFQGSIGRTDFPGGDYDTLIKSIRKKLWPLGDVTFIPGHGERSTFFKEREQNPFVADKLFK